MKRLSEDVTQQVPTKTVVIDVRPHHLFNHESRLKKEAKGGYLEGKIRLFGLTDSDAVEKIELYLVSVHAEPLDRLKMCVVICLQWKA